MHYVFISLPHSLLSIINPGISAYPTIENVYKVTVIDLDKAFDTNITNNNNTRINLSITLTVVLTFMNLKVKYTHRTRC